MRAILVEDDASTAAAIAQAFRRENYVCDMASVAEEALEITKLGKYDIMILDLKLPGKMDGYTLLRRLRQAKVKIPIMILSGLSNVEQKVKGLTFGADDFLTKPFNVSELIARANALIRRYMGHHDSVITVGKLRINIDSRTVAYGGKRVNLTSKEYAIMELLAMRIGSTLSKETFLNHLYGGMDEPELKIIDVFVCKLRRKLAAVSGGKNFIETRWGQGYMLVKSDGCEQSDSGKQTSKSEEETETINS